MQSPKPYREERPWGEFVEFIRNISSTVKIITVKSGESLSLQTHSKRDEFWRILSGEGNVEIDDKRISAKIGDTHFIPRTTKHRIEAGNTDLVVLEISLGDFDEKDIVRLEDKYGRAR
ncbi:MAG: phosphomannose isomerase type II C-terminal cupin domain [Patescibacteria group bacterium]